MDASYKKDIGRLQIRAKKRITHEATTIFWSSIFSLIFLSITRYQPLLFHNTAMYLIDFIEVRVLFFLCEDSLLKQHMCSDQTVMATV